MSLRRSVIWSFGGQGLASVIAFGTSVALAHLLTPHEFGIYAIAVAAQGILQIFATFSVGAYVIRHDHVGEEVLASAFTINAMISLTLTAAMVWLSFAAAPLLGAAEAGGVLRLLALTPVIGIATFRPAAMLQREMRFELISVVLLVNVVVASATTLITALFGASYRSAAYGLVASAAFQALAYSVVGRNHVGWRISFVAWREIVKFGLNIVSVSGVSLMMARLSELALGRILGVASLGLYGRGSGIANILAENVYGTATKISYVKLSQDAREHGNLRPTFLRSMHLITGILWPMQIGLAVLAGPVVRQVYGPKWEGAAVPLSFLMIAQCISLVVGMNWELFALRDEMFRQTKLEITRASFGFAVFVAAVPFGLAMAAASRIAEAAFSILIYSRHVPRLARLVPGELGRNLRQNAVLAIVAAAPSLVLMIATDWSTDVAPIWIGIGIAIGIALWLMAIAMFDHPLWQELRVVSTAMARRRHSAID